MRVLAIIMVIVSAISMGIAVWGHDLRLAAAHFNTALWATLYAFDD